MSRFILIDHSLKGVGGHHFEYAAHVLAAAERAGYQPILATNCRFRPGVGYPPNWPVWPVFRFGTYSKYTLYRSGAAAATDCKASRVRLGAPLRVAAKRFANWWHARGRKRRGDAFAAGLHKLFARQPLDAGDQVFIPTLSELDFGLLAQFLRDAPATRVADWHLQFHYDIFTGREPDYPEQTERLEWMRLALAEALPGLGRHRLHFYNTTAQLTSQYERLGVAAFHTLPYPVNDRLREDLASERRQSKSQKPPQPLRVTCLGAIRAEKGAAELAAVVRQLWNDHFRTGRCQLVVQSNKRRFRLPLPEEHPAAPGGMAPVVYAPHPLAMDAYVDLIRRADVGLLLYDSDRYYVRCSGVLVELLTVGVPVIVTAGTWMAEQIAEANFAHLDRAADTLPRVGGESLANQGDSLVIADNRPTRFSLGSLPKVPGATHALISFSGLEAAPGTYVRIEATTSPVVAIVGGRQGGRPSRVLLPLDGEGPLSLTFQNAYGDASITLRDVRVDFLAAPDEPGEGYPLGAVGLIAADSQHAGPLLANIIAHWPHYRRTAQEFSRQWSAFHNAGRIVAELTAHSNAAAADRRSA